MKKSIRLKPVVKMAENHEQHAAKILGDSRSVLSDADARLSELRQYREEYIQRFHTAGAAGMAASKMGDYQKFLHNLSMAIEQQTHVVRQANEKVEQKRQDWFQSRGKTKMLNKVVSRYQTTELRDSDRKDQKEQDDRSQHRIKKN